MPFYEYECTACGHRLEALRKVSDEPLLYCPECGEASLKRLISRAAFQLKGTGWYETDFKNSGKKNASQRKTDGDASGKADNKTDSKKGNQDAAKTASAAASD